MGYKKDTLRGVSWVGALRGSTRVISFFKHALIARLLTPAEIGVFGIAMLVLAFLEVVTETGVNVVLIQEDDKLLKKYIDTAWVVSILRGLFISIVMFLATPYVAKFFNSPSSSSILYAMSLVPTIRGFINPSIVTFQKYLEFQKDFIFRLAIFSFDAIVAICTTLILRSPMGLVYGIIAGAILEIILSFIMAKPRPKISFEIEKLKYVFNRGKWMTASGVFQYLFREGDDAIVGRVLDTTQLGLYQMAYKIATLPISEVGDVVAKVTFPVFVKINKDKARLKKAYFQTTLAVTAFTAPMGILLILFAREILLFVLGSQWVSAASALQAVAVYAMIRAVIAPSLTLMLAHKKQEYVSFITLIGVVALFAIILPLIGYWGITGAGIATIVASVISLPFVYYFVFKILA